MATWTQTRKNLEENFLCDCLKGRVQYFITRYRGSPDYEGRFCIRVDGKEQFQANPYTYYVKDYYWLENRIKEREGVAPRELDEHFNFTNVEQNEAVEERVRQMAREDGVCEFWDVTRNIDEFLNMPIAESLNAENPFLRLLAVLDRRVGKRTLQRLATELDEQPDWLRFFYLLRLNAEDIRVDR